MRKGWEYKKLGEVCDVLYGYAFDSKMFSDNPEGTPLIRIRDVQRGYSETYYKGEIPEGYTIAEGDYIVGMDGEFNIGRWGKRPGLLNQRVCKMQSSSEDLLNRFMYYFLKVCLKKIEDETPFVTVKHLSAKRINKITIPLPPMSVQESIVKELDKINELIRLKKEQLKDYDNLAQSLFYEMFGDPVTNEKGWEVKKLKDISRDIGDGLHGTPEYTEENKGCYFINGNNLENGKIVMKDNTKMVTEETKSKYYIEMDDFTILVSINGTLGKTAFYNGENIILGKSACYIKMNKDTNKIFVYYLLSSDYFKKYANEECTGTTIRNVSLKSMRNFPVIYPPLPLQQTFATRIEAIERQKAEVQKAITELETLLASRMQYWFE